MSLPYTVLYVKHCIDSQGNRVEIPHPRSAEKTYWSNLWIDAWQNMPRHSGDLLCKLLGYKTRSARGNWLGNGTVYVNKERGSKPRNPQAARLLQMIAGPQGKTIALAIAIQRGIPFK